MIVFTFGLKVTQKGEGRLRALEDFIREHKITKILDVRYNPGNHYKNWNCNGDNICKMLKEKFPLKCSYVSHCELGIPYNIRRNYQKDPGLMELWYLNYLYREELLKTFDFYQNERVLLICVENIKDPKTPYCHRIWLRNYLVENGHELGEVIE